MADYMSTDTGVVLIAFTRMLELELGIDKGVSEVNWGGSAGELPVRSTS